MDPIIETYKTEGNKYFQNCQYNEAIECYTSALKIDPNHVISLGNRSACYLALSLYYEAEIDAKRAIELDKTYIKGYFRLATALKKSKQFVEASRICTIGLEIDPTNVALKKIKSECNQEQVFSRNIFGNLYKDKNQSKNSKIDGEDNQKYENKSSNNTTTATTTTATSTSSLATTSNQNNNQNNNINNNNGNNRKNNSNNNDNILNGVETRMYEYLLGLISRIQSGEFSSSDANSHMLQGTFRKLVERETFSDTLFPGVPLEVSNSLPKNLRELLEWNGVDRCVAQKILQMTKSAAKILEGVRVRGEARGDIMDAATETVLIPQIAQETFAREIVDIVRNLSKRASNLNARLNLSIASPQAPQASLDQLDDHIFEYLANEKSIAVQDTFLGEDWAALVLNDIIRYTKTEKMTDMSFFPHVSTLPRYGDESTNELSTSYIPNLTSSSSLNSSTINNNNNNSNNNSNTSINSTIMNDKVRIAWIESKETAAMYPALSEAIRNLHSLPYEINAKTNTALSLLEPARGFTMLTHVPKNCNQPPRFDNHIGENDSGLRLSCLYLLVPPGEEGESSVAAQYILKTNNNNDDMKIDVIQDRLILYRSLEVKNSRTAAVRDYYQLCFYIHGRYGT